MWRSRQLLYVYLSQYNPQFEPVLLLCEDLKEFKSLNSNKSFILFAQHAPACYTPPNRQSLGKKEPMGGTIPLFGYIRSTRRLDTMASARLGSS